jgi:DNA-binding winged helix-turn-helix (wHTH) protein
VTDLSLHRANASELESAVWQFGDFVLDLPCFELRRNGVPIPVEPQVFDVLTQLVTHHRRVVTKNELLDAVWGGRFVGEAAISSRIKAVRRALGDDGASQQYIRTVRGRGYQFVGALTDQDSDTPEVGRALYFGPPRTRRHSRVIYRAAPSTRRREFSGPPR